MKEFSAYKELVVHGDDNGATWEARIYNRRGPATMLANEFGEAEDWHAARAAASEWADAELEKYRVVPLEVVSSEDIKDHDSSDGAIEGKFKKFF
jgi:hypothetical protein